MRKSIIIGLHLGFWLCFLVLTIVLLVLTLEDEPNSVVDMATERAIYFAIIPALISYYSFYFFIFSYLRQKRFMISIIYALLVSIGAALIGNILIYLFMGIESLTGREESMSVGITFISFVDFAIGVLALITKGFITWYEELKIKEELKQKNHEMELALVKAQLDPHFLFNTLNNIDILILKNANEASNYLNKLSDIMRFMLFETKADKVLLTKEIKYIEKYIALQKIRTANSNYINFEVLGNPNGQMIAPMIFIPFIENAFKHTTNKKLDNAIIIRIHTNKTLVKFECKNKFDPNRKMKQKDGGLGNGLIKKRLELIYPDQHTLDVVNEQNLYSVSLSINL